MADVRLTCTIRSHPQGGHEHITHVGAGQNVCLRQQVVDWTTAGMHTFYVQDTVGRRAEVGVVRPAQGAPYLRTNRDGVWTDDRLALLACS